MAVEEAIESEIEVPPAVPAAAVHSAEVEAVALLPWPAVHEVCPAWAAEVAGECVAVVGVGDRSTSSEDKIMPQEAIKTPKVILWMCVLSLACMSGANCTVFAQAAPRSKNGPAQAAFDTPELAAAALIKATGEYDIASLTSILGPGSDDVIGSGDPVRDKNNAAEFSTWGKEKTSIVLDKSKTRAILSVGTNDWPLPIPLVKHGNRWSFDTKQGRSEILRRRIGANELDAITICRGFVEAQEEYALQIHDNSGINQYAQRIISTPGKRDGLYWKNEDGSGAGPISEPIAKAIQEGYSTDGQAPTAYHGYYFKILKGRGPSAPGGEVDFIVNGVMIGGFALAASPADYGVSGIKSFIVSHEGIVYQKDLGPNSRKVLSQIDRYDPDKTWTKTTDDWPEQSRLSDVPQDEGVPRTHDPGHESSVR